MVVSEYDTYHYALPKVKNFLKYNSIDGSILNKNLTPFLSHVIYKWQIERLAYRALMKRALKKEG